MVRADQSLRETKINGILVVVANYVGICDNCSLDCLSCGHPQKLLIVRRGFE